jgi:hypothetical protein
VEGATMSHWIRLTDADGETLRLPEAHNFAGGTHAVGGTDECTLNITYNYSEHLWRVLGEGGVKSLDGERAVDTIAALQRGVAELGDDVHPNYWEPTEGNAREALKALLVFALEHPDGVWRL